MKKFFRWAGWILFAYITYLLVLEYSGIQMYDTCLFSLGGQSVDLQSADNVFDLSPLLMGIIYIILLITNIVLVFFKKDYISTNISNLILSIPVILVLNVFILDYPPFGNTLFFNVYIFQFILFCYLSAVLFLVFIGYCIVKLLKYKNKHLKGAKS